ncbi:MAG TPA: 6-carboxytetrahydropterin synthase [Candidatus Baltobacteraceae bacterium]|nr:6-carboxytetrahydropterin synthase [Candidatus Baltobacteraceae bacterium]
MMPRVPLVAVTHTLRFSAAHRMHNPRLTAAENQRLYGRCNHPRGHGHTYRLDVTLRGPIALDSGRLADPPDAERLLADTILPRFDQANLDALIGPDDGVTSTTEVLCGVLWRLLAAKLPAGRLDRLRVEETPNNFFELHRAASPPNGKRAER